MPTQTIAEAIVDRLAARGVKRMFGVPGGDCNLDMIEAGARKGVEFVLTRGETAAAIMASVSAELTGVPGVAMTTRGPGLASVANGAAYATLDRAPLGHHCRQLRDRPRSRQPSANRPGVAVAPRAQGREPSRIGRSRRRGRCAARRRVRAAARRRLSRDHRRARALKRSSRHKLGQRQRRARVSTSVDTKSIEAAGKLLSQAARPVIIAGLQARSNSLRPRRYAISPLDGNVRFYSLTRPKASWPIRTLARSVATSTAPPSDPLIEASDLVVLFRF